MAMYMSVAECEGSSGWALWAIVVFRKGHSKRRHSMWLLTFWPWLVRNNGGLQAARVDGAARRE